MIYTTSPLDNSLFYLNAVSIPKRQGVYQKQDGIVVYDDYGLQIVVFPSINHRTIAVVKRLYGVFSAKEV